MQKTLFVLTLVAFFLLLPCACNESNDPLDGDTTDGDFTDGDTAKGNTTDGDTVDGEPSGDDEYTSDNPAVDGEDEFPDGDTCIADMGDYDIPVANPLTCTDGICTDSDSGLEWQQQPTSGTITWNDAKLHCQDLTLDGGGWRLPTIDELRSLIRGCPGAMAGGPCGVTDDCVGTCQDLCCTSCVEHQGPANGCYWPSELQGSCSWYWSSVLAFKDIRAWGVQFEVGAVIFYATANNNTVHARCVR